MRKIFPVIEQLFLYLFKERKKKKNPTQKCFVSYEVKLELKGHAQGRQAGDKDSFSIYLLSAH